MSDYTGVNVSESTWDMGLNRSKVIKIDTSQDQERTPQQIVADRVHPILKKRGWQIETNLLGQKSGRPYVEARLSRYAGEDQISWKGGARAGGGVVTGRKQQAHSVPYLTRISQKINQYVFGEEPKREGIAEDVEADITADGMSINEFMREGNDYLTAAGWYWIKVDAPLIEADEISQAEKEAQKIRPYWQNYSPLSAVDWYINAQGVTEWLLTEEFDYVAKDPTVEPSLEKYRRLWKPGTMTEYHFEKEDGEWTGKIDRVEIHDLSLKDTVPFFVVGVIDGKPHGFDTLESINRTIMDLESCNRQNLFNGVFPQKYYPKSMLETIKDSARGQGETAVAMFVGMDLPIWLDKDDPAPGVIMPEAGSLKTISDDIERLKFNMFEAVGLMLQQQSKQIASAEAKAWDFLDVKQVMKERAGILEDAETKAVELSMKWDSSFQGWTPEYNKSFDVTDPEADMKTIILGQQLELPASMRKIALKKTLDVFKRIGAGDISDEDLEEAMQEIADFQPQTFELLPEPTSEEE